MDAFFASVELIRFPELRGKAVVVGGRGADSPVGQPDGSKRFARLGDYVGRGVVTTSTYEARSLGVFSGMGLMMSAQLAPDAILLPANFDVYRDYSRRFKAAVARIAPKIEDVGIDEIFTDLTDIPEDSASIAKRIKEAVMEATGLTCSIGITPNKLLSKICSDFEKPSGVTILSDKDITERIWPLPVRRITGIGPKANAKLEALGIHTIGQLAKADFQRLTNKFGRNYGTWLHEAAHGRDKRPLVTHREPKSISRESTFERDLDARDDRAALSEYFTTLCVSVADDLQRKGYACRTVSIKLRYSNFHSVTRDITLPHLVSGAAEIRRAASECLKRVPLTQKIRLLGVRTSGLLPSAKRENFRGFQARLPF